MQTYHKNRGLSSNKGLESVFCTWACEVFSVRDQKWKSK